MRALCLALALCLPLAGGCSGLKTKKPSGKPAARSGAKGKNAAPAPKADPQAQEKAYQLGLRLFQEERYDGAKKAWQDAVRLGPDTALGKQAQANLKKVERMLDSLKEIGKQ
ncbi:MAG: hypothetical protein A2X36_03100 [Elusimicrobia bacterium GWA2_69_24]|nr:MAG: hypothetical protein A2X36_03100 [Elusimicrobia bacterium GWA2_69_24]HBL19224.1 hypothetical protein [Elusimicrobiota bacterium]